MQTDIWDKIRRGEIDINNQELYFSTLIKGFVFDLNQHIIIRGEKVNHFFLNTGDDIMYLEKKGVNQALEPINQTNEDYIYNKVPRCLVTPSGINIPTDQLTSPYTTGMFQFEHDDEVHQIRAEFRRLPVEMDIELKYYFNLFTDVLDCTQQLCAKLAFINNFKIVYLGQTISSAYQLPDNIDNEVNMQFDGSTTDSKYKTVSVTMKISSNLPIIRPRTVVPAGKVITNPFGTIGMDERYDYASTIEPIDGDNPPIPASVRGGAHISVHNKNTLQ